MRPHRRQPTRLPRPWDSPGKNTGVGCHFLLQCMKVKVKSLSHVRPSATPWTAAFQAPPSMGFFRQEYWSGVPLPSLDCVIRLLIDASDSSMVIAWYPITVTQYSGGLGRVQSGSWTLTNIMGINYLEGGETGKWTLEGEGDRIVTSAVWSAGAVA